VSEDLANRTQADRGTDEAVQSSEEKQFVVFELSRETYGIEINAVREIIVMQELTTLPKCPDYVKGVINLRGTVIPVFDLACKLGIDSLKESKSSRIIVVEVGEYTIGMIVDAVSEVLMLPADIIEPPSGIIVSGVSEKFIEGIAKRPEQLIIILDLGSTLAGESLGMAC